MDPQQYRTRVAPAVLSMFTRHRGGVNLVKHQTDSFDEFIVSRIRNVVYSCNNIDITHEYLPDAKCHQHRLTVTFSNPRISRPVIHEKDGRVTLLTPQECRLRGVTYSAGLYVDMKVTSKSVVSRTPNLEFSTDEKLINNVLIGKIPIMVKSRFCVTRSMPILGQTDCRYDYGGFFVVNGTEKVIVSNDRMSENQTFVFLNSKTNITYSHCAEIRSVGWNNDGSSTVKSLVLRCSMRPNQYGKYMRVALPHAKQDVPVVVLFKALGLESDREIVDLVTLHCEEEERRIIETNMVGSLAEASEIRCARDAMETLMRSMNFSNNNASVSARLEYVRNVVSRDILPHVGKDFSDKVVYLAYMVKRLLRCVTGMDDPDDRDSYTNKRVDTPGVMLASLFRVHYVRMLKEMRNSISREISGGVWKPSGGFINVVNKINVIKHVKSSIIDSGMKYALATGNWNVKGMTGLTSSQSGGKAAVASAANGNSSRKQGVAQVLNRLTYVATLSHLRRINTPMEKNGKMVQPRKLHNTQWGIICPSECFDPETPILMWDGNIKAAKEIVVGDYLIDDTGNSVRVKSTCSGSKTMYDIVPDKKNFMRYTVTDNHIMTLKVKRFKEIRTFNGKRAVSWFDKKDLRYRQRYFDDEKELNAFYSSLDDDNVIDITIEKYQSLSPYVQSMMYVFKSNGINWERKEVALDPYILGMWLGDGLSSGYGFATADKELLDKWTEWGAENDATVTHGCRYKYHLSSTINRTQPGLNCNKTEQAPLKKLLSKYGLVKNKHIPKEYLVNGRETRLAVLAGLIDTNGNVRANGHEVRICQGEKNYRILHDAEFLARSLGFSCHMNDGICSYTVNCEKRKRPYKELIITGPRLYEIPTVLPRKKLNKFDNPVSVKKGYDRLLSSFKLIAKDVGPFVGWQLEGNGRFLLGDMSLLHNTPEGSSVGLVKNMAMTTTITGFSNPIIVEKRLLEMGLQRGVSKECYPVFLNGRIVGGVTDAVALVRDLKRLKRSCVINIFTSIVLDTRNRLVNINTEAGRIVRPLWVVSEEGRLLMEERARDVVSGALQWWELIWLGYIEYLDVSEAGVAMIAISYDDLVKGSRGVLHRFKYTHMEIDPACILGVLASCIPFSDHNQAPRNTYQCLHLEETVLMADGTKRPIKDVAVGDEVVTFDPKTKLTSTTKVVHQYVRPTDKEIYEIETVSGRKITATANHNFMTTDGWKAVSDFKVDCTKIGVLINPEPVSDEVHDYVVLDAESFREKLEATQVKSSLIQKYVKELKDIFPLNSRHKHLPVLARMCGFLWADGSTNVYFKKHGGWTPQIAANFGAKFDADLFESEIGMMGFRTTEPIEQKRELHGSVRHTWKISHNGAFAALMIALDSRKGKRTELPSPSVPAWVLNGSPLVKREFLSGFQGGDGCVIQIYKGNSPQCPMSYQSCAPEHTENLTEFMDQMQGMMMELGLEMNGTKEADNKYGKIMVGYKIGASQSNLIRYFDTVGYRYDHRKARTSGVTVEFLRAKMLNGLKMSDYEEWKLDVVAEGQSIFVPIKSVTRVENCLISDITVEDDNHSFIAGSNFLSSNSAMGKQAIGVNVSNFDARFDTVNHILHYPQKALVQTSVAQLLRADKLPNGINAIVAIATFTGYNQEDSVIINRSAIQRGLFVSTMYKTFREQNNRNHANGEEEFFCKPDCGATRNMKPCNYEKLAQTGFVPENQMVSEGDIIIGKCMPQKVGASLLYRDNSVPYRGNDVAIVDRNCHNDNYFTTVNGDGYTFAKTRVRCVMEPVMGDKFSSRHAQKGTCGMILDECDMPFTEDGVVPDLIMNAHAIPSRMTIAQLLEGILSKAACVTGVRGNGSAFQKGDFSDISQILEEAGMDGKGDEVMFDPRSGRKMDVKIFMTPTYYQRLKHLSSQKVHSRGANGPVVLLTRQPTEGRSREGALRLGTMEQSVLVAHGVTQFMKERMMDCSDNFRVFTCKQCGMISDSNPDRGMFVCRGCQSSVTFAEVRIPYAGKLLLNEMVALGVGSRIRSH